MRKKTSPLYPLWVVPKGADPAAAVVTLSERVRARVGADVLRYAISRTAFMGAFLADPRVAALFAALLRDTGLEAPVTGPQEFNHLFSQCLREIFSAVARFVRARGLPPWVAWEVVAAFHRLASRRALGRRPGRGLRLQPIRAPRRLGRWPQSKRERIAENARWFYRASVKRPPDSVRSIAREYHQASGHVQPFPACDDRRTVRQGIAEAKRLLHLGQYRWRSARRSIAE